jgi:hypothetical protein
MLDSRYSFVSNILNPKITFFFFLLASSIQYLVSNIQYLIRAYKH